MSEVRNETSSEFKEAREAALKNAPDKVRRAYAIMEKGKPTVDSLGIIIPPEGSRVQVIYEAEMNKHKILHPGDTAISQGLDNCDAIFLTKGKLVDFIHNTGPTPSPHLRAHVIAFNHPDIDLSNEHEMMGLVIANEDKTRLETEPFDQVDIVGRLPEQVAQYLGQGARKVDTHRVTGDEVRKDWKYDVWAVNENGKVRYGIIPSL